jgi:hypothetical protein
MKVRFRQTGGFAGLIRGVELDTSTMPAHEAKALEACVVASRLRAGASKGPAQARDLFHYQITVDTGDQVIHAAFDDATVPHSAGPLLEFLRTRAGPLSPGP